METGPEMDGMTEITIGKRRRKELEDEIQAALMIMEVDTYQVSLEGVAITFNHSFHSMFEPSLHESSFIIPFSPIYRLHPLHAPKRSYNFLCSSFPPQTFLQSVMHRPTQPNPATSTTFSCQLSSTLIDAPLLSFCAPGRPDICEKPVLWGVRFEPRAPGRPDDEEVVVADVEDAMPLYLWLYASALIYAIWSYPIL